MNRRHNAGFTLMEVMVALAILGTALFVLIGAHQSALRLQLESENVLEERQLLEGAVARAEVAVMTGSLGASGEFGPRYPGYGWSFDAVNTSSDGVVPLYQVTARLHTPEGEKKLDFFYFNTGPADQSTNKAELSGKSSVRSGAPNSGMTGSKGMRRMGGDTSSRSSDRSSSRSSGRNSSRGGSFGNSRGSSSRGGSLFQKGLAP